MSTATPSPAGASSGDHGPAPIRVFLVDDHEIVRRGVREVLETTDDIVVVGEASNADEAVRRIPVARPNVAVLDVQLPDRSGVELCRDIRAAHPEVYCVMLTSYDDDQALLDAIVAGAAGFLLKEIRSRDLAESVRKVATGARLMDQRAIDRVVDRLQNPELDGRLQSLSPQEQRIVELLADGLTNRQIAAELHLAEKTVKNYMTGVLAKLGMSRRTEAAVYAARLAERRKPH